MATTAFLHIACVRDSEPIARWAVEVEGKQRDEILCWDLYTLQAQQPKMMLVYDDFMMFMLV